MVLRTKICGRVYSGQSKLQQFNDQFSNSYLYYKVVVVVVINIRLFRRLPCASRHNLRCLVSLAVYSGFLNESSAEMIQSCF